MDRRNVPWIGLALVLMAVFIVWLLAQMSRTPARSGYAEIIGACAVLVALTGAVVMGLAALDKRRSRR